MVKKTKTHLPYADGIRVAAIFAVVAYHAFSTGVFGPDHLVGLSWWASNIIYCCFSWCVPMFIMLSGALLLDPDRDEGFSEFYSKRISRIGIPLVFWTVFYLVWSVYFLKQGMSPQLMIARILRGDSHYHLHFLFLILGLYMFTPMFRVFTREAKSKEVATIGLLFLAFSAGDWFYTNYVAEISSLNAFNRFFPYIGYYLMGYVLSQTKISTGYISAAALTAAVCILFIAIGTGFSFEEGLPLAVSTATSPVVMVLSISMFILFRALFTEFPFEKVTTALAPLTLGIYLVHIAVMDVIRKVNVNAYDAHPLPAMASFAISGFVISTAACIVIRKILFLRRVI